MIGMGVFSKPIEELWEVCNINTDYYISNLGNIQHIQKERILKPTKNTNGYMVVNLCKKTHYIHRLVASAFIPNPDNKPNIDHKNCIKYDNCVYNLRWCNQHENSGNYTTTNNNTTGIRGVSFNKRKNKYEVSIKIKGKKHFLGFYDNLDKAIQVRKEKDLDIFKDFSIHHSLSCSSSS